MFLSFPEAQYPELAPCRQWGLCRQSWAKERVCLLFLLPRLGTHSPGCGAQAPLLWCSGDPHSFEQQDQRVFYVNRRKQWDRILGRCRAFTFFPEPLPPAAPWGKAQVIMEPWIFHQACSKMVLSPCCMFPTGLWAAEPQGKSRQSSHCPCQDSGGAFRRLGLRETTPRLSCLYMLWSA